MPNVQVAGYIFPSFNSTEGIAVELYLSGCNRHPKCEGCHNELLWDFNYGESIDIDDVIQTLKYKYRDADSIAIMGGEPLNHPNLHDLLRRIKRFLPEKSLWLYTSYDMPEVPRGILACVDFVKTGRYEKDKHTKDRLGSYNQIIWKKEIKDKETEFRVFYQYGGGK